MPYRKITSAAVRTTASIHLIGLFGLAIGCSSDDGGGSGEEEVDEGSGGRASVPPEGSGGSAGEAMIPPPPDCDPNGEIPCIEGTAEPCRGLESGFSGDEYCLAPPDPELGMQIHIGPDEYSDPDQTAQYTIQPGDETNWYEVAQFPNPENVFTRGYRSHMRPGSHHFIMYGNDQGVVGGPMTNGDGTEAAAGIGGRFLGGATRAIQNIDTRGEHPEDQGIGTEIAGDTYVTMNLHYVNTEDLPLLQELWVNFIYIPEDEVTQYVKPITWYGGFGMSIPPGDSQTLTNAGQTVCQVPSPMPEGMRIGMMTAHMHANAVRETARMNGSTVLFEEYDWHEPTEWRFNYTQENPTPDPVGGVSGGYTGPMHLNPGDSFTWECEVHNQTDVTLTFGNKVYEGEMCMVFGYFFSKERQTPPWMCAFF